MKTYTSARISEDTLFWLFGVVLGLIDGATQTLSALEMEAEKVIQETAKKYSCSEKEAPTIIIIKYET